MKEKLNQFEEYLIAQGKATSTAKHALIYVKGFLYSSEVTDLAQVKTETVLDYLTRLEGRSQARVNQAIWALRLFFTWANVPGLGFPRQKQSLKKKIIRPLTEQEAEAIDYWMHMHALDPIYYRRHVFMLMFYSGLRVKDLMSLTWGDITFNDESGEGESTFEITKEGIKRTVRIPVGLSYDLQYYLKWYGGETNAFNVTIGNLNYTCKYLNEYDILGDGRKIYPELFRASFACRCLEQGMSPRELQKLMGHKSIRSTRRYLKLMVKKEVKSPDEGTVS